MTGTASLGASSEGNLAEALKHAAVRGLLESMPPEYQPPGSSTAADKLAQHRLMQQLMSHERVPHPVQAPIRVNQLASTTHAAAAQFGGHMYMNCHEGGGTVMRHGSQRVHLPPQTGHRQSRAFPAHVQSTGGLQYHAPYELVDSLPGQPQDHYSEPASLDQLHESQAVGQEGSVQWEAADDANLWAHPRDDGRHGGGGVVHHGNAHHPLRGQALTRLQQHQPTSYAVPVRTGQGNVSGVAHSRSRKQTHARPAVPQKAPLGGGRVGANVVASGMGTNLLQDKQGTPVAVAVPPIQSGLNFDGGGLGGSQAMQVALQVAAMQGNGKPNISMGGNIDIQAQARQVALQAAALLQRQGNLEVSAGGNAANHDQGLPELPLSAPAVTGHCVECRCRWPWCRKVASAASHTTSSC